MPNISLTSINSALEKKMDGTDSSSNLTDVLRLAKSADNFTSTVFYIDSSYLPTDSAFIGTLARDSDGTVYAYDGSSWTRPNKDGSITIPYIFGGTTSGYMSGGRAAPPYSNTIDKWPFASDGNATDVGNLTIARERGAGQSSKVSGYTSGGIGSPVNNNRIDKFPFAADGNATDVGDLTGTLRENAGQSSENHGYTTGGHDGSPHPGEINDIQKFSFSSDGNATDVGDRTITGDTAGTFVNQVKSGSRPDTHIRSRNVAFTANGLQPFTGYYPFFDSTSGIDVIPKLIEITMVSGSFQSGETVISGGDEVTLRICQPNHKTGDINNPASTFSNNPYNTSITLPTGYSASTTVLNVDIAALAEEAQGRFSGRISKGMTLLGQRSGAVATVSDIRIITDKFGDIFLSLIHI